MRLSSKLIAGLAQLGCCIGLEAQCMFAQGRPTASELVQELRSEKTTWQASNRLLKLGKADPEVRKYLATSLPHLIEIGLRSCPLEEGDLNVWRQSCPWHNAVELAGKLKIAEAAPALAKWINWRDAGPLGLSLEARLVFYPAATALWQIGDPAVPTLQHVLESGNPDERYRAVRVLCIIHTAKAKAVLRDDLPHESDPDLRAMIKRALEEK